MTQCVPTGSLASLHVYFPDPWWKTRHHKRRLFTADFVAVAAKALTPGGRWHVATDVPDYATIIAELLDAEPGLMRLEPPAEETPGHDMDYLTNFERKFRKAGKPIHRLLYEKIDY